MTGMAPSVGARQAMERLNTEAGKLHIWLRTQANAPAQRPWFRETGLGASGQVAAGRVGAAQLKAVAYHWRWAEIGPCLGRRGVTETAGQRFGRKTNDIFVVPGFAWRRHINASNMDAILYSVSDAPLLDKIGQYRAQGRLPDDTVAELVP